MQNERGAAFMKTNKILGILLLLLAISVIIGFTIGNNTWWLVVDVFVIVICGAGGVFLLRISNS